MKKLLSLILAGSMLFSLAACGGSSESKDDDSNKKNSSDIVENNGGVGEENDGFVADKDDSDADFSDTQVGDYITFGSYEQDNDLSNGKEPVEWLVLDKQDGKVLVISKYVLDAKKYNEEKTAVTWERCSVRHWLNEDFYNVAFSDTEKTDVLSSEVVAHLNPDSDADSGNNTQDKLFLLSIEEADSYFTSDEERICQITEYAIGQGAPDNYEGNARWILRTPGSQNKFAASVHYDGDVMVGGGVVTNVMGVRPAMWIEL